MCTDLLSPKSLIRIVQILPVDDFVTSAIHILTVNFPSTGMNDDYLLRSFLNRSPYTFCIISYVLRKCVSKFKTTFKICSLLHCVFKTRKQNLCHKKVHKFLTFQPTHIYIKLGPYLSNIIDVQ